LRAINWQVPHIHSFSIYLVF